MLTMMLTALSFAAPATPDAATEDDRRYRNRFTGLGYVVEPASDTLALRVHGLSAPTGGGIFARGGDLDIGVSLDGDHTVQVRSLFGINVVPGDRLRMAVYSGAGLRPSVPAVLSLTNQETPDGRIVDVLVPVMAEVGVSIGRSIGLHARGGLNLVPLSVTNSDDGLGFGKGERTLEGVLSASFGTPQGARIRGFRVEAGHMHGAWSVMIGIGG